MGTTQKCWVLFRTNPSSTKLQFHSNLPSITQTIYEMQTRYVRHGWKTKQEFSSDVLEWIPTYGLISIAWPIKTTFINSVHKLGVILRTNKDRWPIGAVDNRESRKSMLPTYLNDNDYNDDVKKMADSTLIRPISRSTSVSLISTMLPLFTFLW